MSIFVKLLVPLLIYTSVFWFCTNSQKTNRRVQAQNNLTKIDTPSVAKLQIEDPSTPPYKMFVAAYQKEVKLFTFNLPARQIIASTDTLIQIQFPEQKDGLGELLSISVAYNNCNTKNDVDVPYIEPTKWSAITIGKQVFNRGTTGLNSINPTYIYSWQQNQCCFTFTFQFNTGIAFENEPPPPVFNGPKQEAAIKALLQTIVLNPK